MDLTRGKRCKKSAAKRDLHTLRNEKIYEVAGKLGFSEVDNMGNPKETLMQFIEAFNNADVDKISSLYDENAVNHQVANEPVIGKAEIKKMFEQEFSMAKMICIVENIFEDGEWAIMEWKDPLGLRGCGFFHIQNDRIVFQRGYWDKLSFLKQHNFPVE